MLYIYIYIHIYICYIYIYIYCIYVNTYIHVIHVYSHIPDNEFSFVMHVKLKKSVGTQQTRSLQSLYTGLKITMEK